MPCICDGAETQDEYMNRIINTEEFKKINSLLKEAKEMIKDQYLSFDYIYQRELDEETQKKAWLKAFEHHLFGCNEKNNTVYAKSMIKINEVLNG